LWDAACSIRGAIDAPKFKDYILPLIFVKRLSDVFDDEIEHLAEKFDDRDVALALVDEDHSLVRFYIPPEASWAEVRNLTEKLGQNLTEVVRAVADANPSLQGVIDIVDFNATISGQRIIEDGRLSKLIEILSRHRLGLDDVEPDLFGRAYEYLLRKFAEGQGQSAGEFFTPKEVGWLIARLLRAEEGMEVYDPACGSAGLLIKAELTVKESVETVKRPLQLYGQELNHVTFAIAKMNMIIHDMEGEIGIGDTFRNPKFLAGSKLKTFDLVAANPMWNQDGYDTDFYDTDPFDRFKLGYAPASTADWGWVQHMLASLNERGRAVIVLDTGAVSRGSGGKGSNRERDIRKQFVDRDLIEGVVLLPENLFYNTTAPGILLCLNQAKSKDRKGRIILVNASKEFEKGRPKNFVPNESIQRIARAFEAGEDAPNFLAVITTEEAAKNDYNLSPSRYIAVEGATNVLPVEDAIVLLKEAEEERVAADVEFAETMKELGFEGWRHA
jgi:type I restriction enzyme M protein